MLGLCVCVYESVYINVCSGSAGHISYVQLTISADRSSRSACTMNMYVCVCVCVCVCVLMHVCAVDYFS
jgi:hypothetical protein